MLNDRVLLTYKRKRFLCQNDAVIDTKMTNLASDISRKPSVDAHDEEFRNPYLGTIQCSAFDSRNVFHESVQHHCSANEGMKKCNATGKHDMEHGSCELLNSANAIGRILPKAGSTPIHASLSKEKDTIQPNKLGLSSKTCAGGNSSEICAVNSQMGNLVHLTKNIDSEAKEFGTDCSLGGAKMSLNSNRGAIANNVCGDESMRFSSRSPVITFFRRKAKNKHVLGESFTGGGLFKDHNFEEKANCTSTMLEKFVDSTPNVEVGQVMPDVNLAAMTDCTLAEVPTGLDLKRVETSSELLMPPISKEPHAMQVVKDKVLPEDNEPSNSGNNGFPLTSEITGNRLITDKDSIEKRKILISDERCSPACLELSAVPVSACHERTVTSKQFDDFVSPDHITSVKLASPCCPILLSYEKTDARNRELEWLEKLDNFLSEKNKARNSCSSNVHDNIGCREGYSSIIAKKSNHFLNYRGTPIDNAHLPKNLPEKLPLAHSVDPFPEEQQGKEKLTTFTDFLGLCPPSNPDRLIDLNSTPVLSSSSGYLRGSFSMQHMEVPCSLNGNPSLFLPKQIAEFSVADMVLRGRHGYLSEMPKRFSGQWSEEELDFLWIGVRRHGTLNWNAVLSDPKLRFVQSRTSEDLALQWEEEQKKVFNDIFPTAMLPKPNFFSNSCLDGQPENPMHTAETKLSLGGVYVHKENILNTGQFNPLGFGINFPSIRECSSTCVLPGSYLSVSKYPRLSTRQQMLAAAASTTIFQAEYGCHKRCSDGSAQEQLQQQQQQAGSNLPHWLKDVSSSHPSRSDLSLWPHFTSGNDMGFSNSDTSLCLPVSNVAELLVTSKDLKGRGILKRKNAVFCKPPGSVRIREASPSVMESVSGMKPGVVSNQNLASERPALCLGASHAADLSCAASAPIVSSELVVLDSDLSSEETISDDQSSRP